MVGRVHGTMFEIGFFCKPVQRQCAVLAEFGIVESKSDHPVLRHILRHAVALGIFFKAAGRAAAELARAPAKPETCLPALRVTLLLAEAAERLSLLKNQGAGAALVGGDMDRASRLDYLINSCFMCDLSAKYAAESLYISERQLMRITKKRYGTTFRQALQDKRLEVAEKLLSETDDSVAAICRKAGFRSASHFYRSFGDRFGLTPSEYRSNRLEKKES